ncbi:duf323 domain containing protein [Grosmannia clavigera kw1407]|uniref:Duf323 domain containing protein n=1 Tax=Grosmannia clavigera (strain kw1407 / UAMH 11150) TaxID=655863 RepID=F0XFG8_GROCL|nr:duf323 domain containing protein [Grosmannia clavigera kw1407]EFX04429.1 duf323 domain containing protein [Grosmannia clavigera kw1407]
MPPSAEPLVSSDSDSAAHHLLSMSLASKAAALHVEANRHVDIIDIRRGELEINLKQEIFSSFSPEDGPRALPTLLLYDEKGLQLFEQITFLEQYYLTNYEAAILEASAASIAAKIPQGAMVLELGSGNLRKVSLLLRAFEAVGKKVEYYALDLSRRELERTLAQLPKFEHVTCHGLLGTYDDGREWLKSPSVLYRQKCILSLGSSIGNFQPNEAAEFLRSFADVLQMGDAMLIGLDSCTDPRKIYHAYNDNQGTTHRFILNGLAHANEILGEEAFQPSEWHVIGEYVHDARGGYHQAFVSPIHTTVVLGETVRAYERIKFEESWKYADDEVKALWQAAGLVESCRWEHSNKEYGIHMLSKQKMSFSLLPSIYAKTALPSLEDWEATWAAWDTVTRRMLPDEGLLDKPIKLRNACIFYLGHSPTFLDIQLNKTIGGTPTEPASYASIFERGIDPDVDNPELCHSHSEIPDEWPPLNDILAYQSRVRERLRGIYGPGNGSNPSHAHIPRPVAQAIWAGFEHDLMHLETLLYMMLQSDKTLPPPNVPRPDFAELAEKAHAARVPNQWFNVPAQDISIGLDDPENGTELTRHFGWDNEKPVRRIHVGAFQAKGRSITNEETNGHTNGHANGHANGHTNGHQIGQVNGAGQSAATLPLPASFLQGMAVRTVFGPVPLELALDWPVFASYDELSACAAWMGGRIPTFEEARSIYEHVDRLRKKKEKNQNSSRAVPAVNGHLSLNGVKETPPQAANGNGGAGASSDSLFIDLEGANVGLKHWHPMPVTANGGRLGGQSEMGGVWEWTSSPLHRHAGFEPMKLYPAYTADFFDGKHNIVLGGSWATHPRLAGRKSFVNWFQRNYLYAWVGARLVRDV